MPSRFARVIMTALAVLMVARQVAALLPLTWRLWGMNFFGYLPFWTQLVLTGMSLALFLPSVQAVIWTRSLAWKSKVHSLLRRIRVSPTIAVAFTATFFFWVLRVRTFLLGDGQVLINDAAIVKSSSTLADIIGWSVKTHTPLATFLYFLSAKIGQEIFHFTVAETFQGLACIAGGVYVLLVLLWLSRVLRHSAHRFVGCCLLLFHGGILFYFGYVEYYTIFHLSTTLYCMFGVSALRNRATLLWPSLFFALSIGFHIIGLVLLPSYILLILTNVSFARVRRFVDFKYVVPGVFFLSALLTVVYVATGEYQLRRNFLPITSLDVDMHYTLFSAEHILDVANALILLSAPATITLLAYAFDRFRGQPEQQQDVLFLFSVTFFQAMFLFFVNTDLGFARDWDVAASMSAGLLVLAVVILEPVLRARESGPMAVGIGGAAIFLSLPFVIVHASETMSVARFQDLLTMDRAVVGNYRIAYGYEMLAIHFRRQGDHERERSFLMRAAETHDNIRFYENLLISFERHGVRSHEWSKLIGVVHRFRRELLSRTVDVSDSTSEDHLMMYYVGLRLMREQGLCKEAQPLYEEAILRDIPRREYAYIGLGQCLLARGDTLQAVQQYDRARGISDVVERDLRLMADAYYAVGRYDDAASLYAKVLALNQGDEVAFLHCAVSYSKLQRWQEARRLLERYLEQFPLGHYRAEALKLMNQPDGK